MHYSEFRVCYTYCLLVNIGNTIIIVIIVTHLLTVKLRFQEWSQSSNLTIQPPLSPGRLKEGRYLVLKVGAIDRGE